MNFQRSHQVSDRFHELTKHCTTVTERYPLHCGLSVLHYSKRILMEFILFLYEFLIENSFELCYSGKLFLFREILPIIEHLRYRQRSSLFNRFFGKSGSTRKTSRMVGSEEKMVCPRPWKCMGFKTTGKDEVGVVDNQWWDGRVSIKNLTQKNH